jgi:DNA polymerase-3 subunit epsilon
MGGRQSSLSLGIARVESAVAAAARAIRVRARPLASRLSQEDIAAHRAFLSRLGGEPLWLRYRPPEPADAAAS